MAVSTTDVAEALNGVTIAQQSGENDLQQIKGLSNIKNNGSGSFTIAAGDDQGTSFPALTFTYVGQETVTGSNLTNSGYFGTATSETLPVVSWVFSTAVFNAYVLAIDPTHVLLIGVTPTTSGGVTTWAQNANRFLLTTGGPDTDLATNPLTLNSTSATYTPPSGTTISCFVSGTRIATPAGFALVENLAEGDLVTTISGDAKPVIWAGQRTLRVSLHRNPELVRPVTIRAGAFGDGLPVRDLTVSADHNVFVDGVLIPAKCLVNDLNVVFSDVERVTYHHIELAAHDVVFAEGLPTETYLEVGNRSVFAGGAVVDAHPDFASTPDSSYFAFEARGYAKLVLAGAELDAVRARLAAQADSKADADRKAA